MAQPTFDNFGDLYRAAFAEQDPERKLVLLSEVRRAIAKWEEEIAKSAVVERPKPPVVVTAFPPAQTFGSKQIA